MTIARILLLGAALVGLGAPARAQTVKDIEAKEAELVAVWERTPLSIRRALFVTERAQLYGNAKERPTNVFRPGEPLLTYVEPAGYSYKAGPDGFAFGLTIDFLIKSGGKVLGGQEKFMSYGQASQRKVRELMINISLDITGAAPGDYVVEYTFRDTGNGKTASFEQPFKIAN